MAIPDPPALVDAPFALSVAFVLVVGETVVEMVYVGGRDDLTPGLRAVLLAAFFVKVVFAARTRRLKPGSAMGLLLFESVGIVAALAADWATLARVAMIAVVVTVLALVASSLHAFPSPDLP